MDRWMEITDSSSECLKPQLPPGFRFHPTDEELVVHYLKKKAAAAPLPVSIIAEVDIYKFDPWELPAKAIFGEQEWYFFSPRDRKYPNGSRPNRAATSGYWKATGTDKPVMTAQGTQRVGVKKALVFYVGKPPKGVKTNWIMHEYRLDHNKVASMKPFGCDGGNKKGSLRLDDWVLCRIYKKSDAQIIRHIDQEKDDTNRAIGSIHPTILMPDGQHKLQGFKAFSYGSLLETDDDDKLYQGMVMTNDSIIGQETPQPPLMVDDPNLLASKRMLPSLYWNDDEGNAKRFLAEGCEGRADVTTNNIATILSQLPQGTSLQHQAMVGTLGDGVFRQAQPYQVSGMNWYS